LRWFLMQSTVFPTCNEENTCRNSFTASGSHRREPESRRN